MSNRIYTKKRTEYQSETNIIYIYIYIELRNKPSLPEANENRLSHYQTNTENLKVNIVNMKQTTERTVTAFFKHILHDEGEL